ALIGGGGDAGHEGNEGNEGNAGNGGSQDGGGGQASLADAYYAVQAFLRTAALFDERFVAYAESDRRDVTIKLLCLDPSELLRQAAKGYRAKIMLSATLSPLTY